VYWKLAGITPTMVYDLPLSVSVFPTASGEQPNFRFQKPPLISTTSAAVHSIRVAPCSM
jgi:hypothetical protein